MIIETLFFQNKDVADVQRKQNNDP